MATETTIVEPRVVVVNAGQPGPKGPKGDKGDPGDGSIDGLLQIGLRLAEFDTEQAKADARASIGLTTIDGGTFN